MSDQNQSERKSVHRNQSRDLSKLWTIDETIRKSDDREQHEHLPNVLTQTHDIMEHNETRLKRDSTMDTSTGESEYLSSRKHVSESDVKIMTDKHFISGPPNVKIKKQRRVSHYEFLQNKVMYRSICAVFLFLSVVAILVALAAM